MQYLNKAASRVTSSLKQSSLSKYIACAVHPHVWHISSRVQGTTWETHENCRVEEAAFQFWKCEFPHQVSQCKWEVMHDLTNLVHSVCLAALQKSGTLSFAQESTCKGRVQFYVRNEGKIRIWKKCRGRKNKCVLYTTQVTNDMHTFMFIYKYKQKDSESLGESSTPQAYMVVSHKFLPRSNSCKDLALPDFNRLVLWDIWKDDQDLVWFKWPMTLKPKAQVI